MRALESHTARLGLAAALQTEAGGSRAVAAEPAGVPGERAGDEGGARKGSLLILVLAWSQLLLEE